MTASINAPWVALKDVCYMYGVKYTTAMNKVRDGTFDVTVYKVGKTWVIDREVHEAYFRRMREAGLAALHSTNSGQVAERH